MSEMIERVARALEHKSIERGYSISPLARHLAVAAIEAMREPTAGMVAAVRRAKPHDMDITESWPIAIDEALK